MRHYGKPGEKQRKPPLHAAYVDDAELNNALQELISALISHLDRRYAEVVWRAEILGQSPAMIAQELSLSEQMTASYLKLGRRQLVRLISLTLCCSLDE